MNEWVPAFPGQRPPFFKDGNECALRHGAHSPKLVNPRRDEIVAGLRQAMPHLDNEGYGPQLSRYGTTLAQIERLDAWLEEHGVIGKGGSIKPAAKFRADLDKLALNLAGALGLTPVSHARVLRDLGEAGRSQVDIAKAQEEYLREQRGSA
ncbi:MULTISPECIES: P27 family phage terminase small subunit [Gordonia]|uniref:P27 family phage terminase small subunit n=2 Tax=Gordonia TaxID=2053 RepID=A0ABR5IG68_9ACTN|nr:MULTISPECIES: P27 family phage terminase small subunit [Gordonia]KNA92730.1 hypothetical protein ABW18_05555 [Gordonia jacobaea]